MGATLKMKECYTCLLYTSDVSQTEGEPLPSIAVNELSGSVQDYQDFFKALEQTSPVPIGFEDIELSLIHICKNPALPERKVLHGRHPFRQPESGQRTHCGCRNRKFSQRDVYKRQVLPIAAAILALVMCHELIQMITEKNKIGRAHV